MFPVGRTRQSDKHLPPRVYKKHGAFYFVPKQRDRQRYGGSWIKLDTDEGLAVKAYYNLTEPPQDCIEAIWQWYSKRWLVKNAERTQKDKEHYWGILKPVFGLCHPDEIEPGDIYDYLDKRESQGAGVQGNREIALLSHMYTKAVQKRMARFNPCLRVERNEEHERTLDVTSDMLKTWMSFAPAKLALAAELMYMTGLRSPDILTIELNDLKADAFPIRSKKTGKKGWTPWDEELRDIVADIKKLAINKKGKRLATQYLFCTGRGRQYSKSGFDSNWQKAMCKYAKAGFVRFAPNDCRASHASDLEEQGGDATKNLQHSARRITQKHYLRRGEKLVHLGRVK